MSTTSNASGSTVSRRDVLAGAAGVLAASAVSAAVLAAGSKAGATPRNPTQPTGDGSMPLITTKDGTQIFYKDWGTGQPIVFHHGWPLSADDWDAQMLFFLERGYRVIAHDRRGHGRSLGLHQGIGGRPDSQPLFWPSSSSSGLGLASGGCGLSHLVFADMRTANNHRCSASDKHIS